MLERLAHPVIVRGFAAALDGPRPHIVLEHLEGPRLSTLVRRYGPLPTEQLVPLALELTAAIHYLRTEGVVHLDVKPSNTIMGAPPRLIDLSVALTIEDAAGVESAVGTDAYMAPEQCDPRRLGPVGPAADVWGLGVTLFKAATGTLPFDRPERDAVDGPGRWPQLRQDPQWPEPAPDPLAALIMLCLERDPARRPEPADLHAALLADPRRAAEAAAVAAQAAALALGGRMPGARWIAIILLVLAVAGLLILPELLRGSREAHIEPVRVEPPTASRGSPTTDREDATRRAERERRGDRSASTETEPATEPAPSPEAASPPPAPSAPAAPAPAPSPAPTEQAEDDDGDGDDGGGGGGGGGGSPAASAARHEPAGAATGPGRTTAPAARSGRGGRRTTRMTRMMGESEESGD